MTMTDHPAPLPDHPKLPGSWRPVILAGIAVVLFTFGGLGTWGSMASLDSAAVAPGVVAVESNRKLVQHLEGGIVKEILAHEGDLVHKGDVLVRLDDTRARAVLEIIQVELDATEASRARLLAQRDELDEIAFPQELVARATGNPKVREAIEGQRRFFKAQMDSIQGQYAIMAQRTVQLEQEIDGLEAQQAARRQQVSLLEEELAAYRKLREGGNVAKTQILALEREIARLKGEEGQYISNIARAQQGIGKARLETIQLKNDFQQNVAGQLRDVESSIYKLEERLIAARDVLDRTEIRAPDTGIVIGMQAHTVGGVISPGGEVMQIVPAGDKLIIEARISPNDVDDVAVGQNATIRFASFRRRSNYVISGILVNVSADRVTDSRSGMAYFSARIEVPKDQLALLGDEKVMPGMPVDVLVKTGRRTALDYVFAPIEESLAKAFKEK